MCWLLSALPTWGCSRAYHPYPFQVFVLLTIPNTVLLFLTFYFDPHIGGSPCAIYLTALLSPASFDCPSPCVPVSLLSSLLFVARSLCYSTHSMIARPLLSKLVFCSTLTLASFSLSTWIPLATSKPTPAWPLQANGRLTSYCGQSSRLMHPCIVCYPSYATRKLSVYHCGHPSR